MIDLFGISLVKARITISKIIRNTWKYLTSKLSIRDFAIGTFLFASSNFLFDYILYALAIKYFGLLIGGAIMTIASAIICFVAVLFYRSSGRDWLGIEAVRSIKADFIRRENKSLFARLIAWLWRKGAIVEFLILSLKFDPFVTTEYLKSEHGRTKLDKRDWSIFIASIFVANVYWAMIMFAGVTIIDNIAFSSDFYTELLNKLSKSL